MDQPVQERHGVLVGWTSQDLGDKLVLSLQTFERQGWDSGTPPDTNRVMMTRSQAIVLANYLLKMAEAPEPAKKPGWISSLFS